MGDNLFTAVSDLDYGEYLLTLRQPHKVFSEGQRITITDYNGSHEYIVKTVQPGDEGSFTYELEPVTE